MAQAVPLRGVLQRQRGLVVRQHVDRAFLQARHLEVQVRLAVAARGRQRRRMAARIEHVAARQVQRQRQAEDLAGAHCARPAALFFGQQVQAADLVVRSEIAPGRSSGRRVQRFMGLSPVGFRVYMNIVRIYVLLIHRHSSDCRHLTPGRPRGSACGWRRARHAAWPAWFKVGSQWFCMCAYRARRQAARMRHPRQSGAGPQALKETQTHDATTACARPAGRIRLHHRGAGRGDGAGRRSRLSRTSRDRGRAIRRAAG